MRLIDAEAAKEDFKSAAERPEEKVLALIFGEWLDDMPTIDPVKHGEWEMLMGWPFPEWRCSQCGNHICGDLEHLKKWNYCPNCGARMEGEEDDSDKD